MSKSNFIHFKIIKIQSQDYLELFIFGQNVFLTTAEDDSMSIHEPEAKRYIHGTDYPRASKPSAGDFKL